jgi:NAD(P)-dependent dehydrogenase (short-subunit alcohol dehydrogenase family)
MTYKFEGKVAVILGGSTGDWPRCSKAVCSRRQDHVFIEGRRKDPLDAAVAEIGRKATGLKGDVANLADLDRLYESVKGQDRKIDVILPNAGVAQLPAFGTVQDRRGKTFRASSRCGADQVRTQFRAGPESDSSAAQEGGRERGGTS